MGRLRRNLRQDAALRRFNASLGRSTSTTSTRIPLIKQHVDVEKVPIPDDEEETRVETPIQIPELPTAIAIEEVDVVAIEEVAKEEEEEEEEEEVIRKSQLPFIEFKHLALAIRELRRLKEEWPRKRRCAYIMGPSGCGKTSLVKHVVGSDITIFQCPDSKEDDEIMQRDVRTAIGAYTLGNKKKASSSRPSILFDDFDEFSAASVSWICRLVHSATETSPFIVFASQFSAPQPVHKICSSPHIRMIPFPQAEACSLMERELLHLNLHISLDTAQELIDSFGGDIRWLLTQATNGLCKTASSIESHIQWDSQRCFREACFSTKFDAACNAIDRASDITIMTNMLKSNLPKLHPQSIQHISAAYDLLSESDLISSMSNFNGDCVYFTEAWRASRCLIAGAIRRSVGRIQYNTTFTTTPPGQYRKTRTKNGFDYAMWNGNGVRDISNIDEDDDSPDSPDDCINEMADESIQAMP